jgi:uncharacterized membrane protein
MRSPDVSQEPRNNQKDETKGPPVSIVERNIHAVLEHRRAEQNRRSRQDRIADAVTAFTGSMTFVYLHLALFGAWIIGNLPWVPWPRFDPTFVVLAMFASVEAIFLSTFVLITQNRMAAMAEKRAELDLQVSLLAEQEITQIIKLVTEIAQRVNVNPEPKAEIEEMKQVTHPETVLEQLDREEYSSHVGRPPF